MRAYPHRPPADRLWEKVDKHPGAGCWVFTGSKDSKGYGRINIDGRPVSAHRLAWELTYGPIQEGQDVLHSCDNPPCVRHLWLGTQADNVRDMIAKGRARYVTYHGEQHGRAKLTEAQVQEIRRLHGEGHVTQSALARRFGVTRTAIQHILTGRNWAWLAGQRPVDKASTST